MAVSGGSVLVDPERAAMVLTEGWYIDKEGYCRRHQRAREIAPGGKRRTLYLQRVVLGLPPGKDPVADHINRDRLDCRRVNLRAVSWGENGFGRIQERDRANSRQIGNKPDNKTYMTTVGGSGVDDF